MHNLVAVAALCDSGCRVLFDPEEVKVTKDGRQIISGQRDFKICLLCIPIIDMVAKLPQEVTEQRPHANVAVQLNTKDYMAHMVNSVYDCNAQEQLIKFYHETMLSPVKKTFLEATRRGYLQG
eukprot:6418395-Ditylum_brightwellii.AAC.1